MTGIKKKELGIGIFLLATFAVVMVTIFIPLPILDGGNALNYLDNLYNSISKGSAYYILKVEHLVEEHGSEVVTLNLELDDSRTAQATEPLFTRAGATITIEGDTLMVNGDIESIFRTCLEDAQSAYDNRGDDLVARYGTDARTTLYNWWQALGAMEKDLNRQKFFATAKLTHTVQAKAVECAYNYYGIETQAIKNRWGTVLFSLVFYVLYTIWYGYGIMFVFEGLGFELAAH